MATSAAVPRNRMAHWVLRVTELEKTVEFFKTVFGMVTIRHEENPAACKITCNGRFDRPWSKTMMGYQGHTEDKWYCLELTYNYGVRKYDVDNGIRAISITTPSDPKTVIETATKLGYAEGPPQDDGARTILGPDNYPYVPIQDTAEGTSHKSEEPFVGVTIVVNDLEASKKFYTEVLDMEPVEEAAEGAANKVVLKYATLEGTGTSASSRGNTTYLVLEQKAADAPAIKPSAHSGRLAISCGDVAGYYKKFATDKVLHEMQILDEPLGKLEIAIVLDPDNYEICLVTSSVFDPSTKAAANWEDPPWEKRREMGGK
ncbi:unnamed protein product [Amoebophrya sp. A120]|nr:unnamed protein product [Amoebophrya sp. A120]|eukprot:GSA120T00018796001.1